MTTSKIRLVTDTTASMPAGFAAAHQIEVVPQVILFGEESFLEDVNLTYPEFIRRLKSSPQLPKTAAPPPGEMIRAYERQLAHAATLFSIHPSLEVSGTVRSALTAKEEHFPQADIRVIDTRTISGNLGTLVRRAAEEIAQGVAADEIERRLRERIPRSRTFFLVATLEYLQKGGRIGGAAALVGSLLQVKPLLEIRQGRVEALEKIRTHHKAVKRLQELVSEQCPRTLEAQLCVMHADDLPEAQKLADDLQQTLQLEQIPIYSLGASITTHAGPGALGVGFFA